MNNDAFKNLVRDYSDKKTLFDSGSSSSKVIARNAVEEEFRKKKRKRGGEGGLSYSSDEDCDHQSSFKRSSGRQQHQRKEEAKGNDADVIQKGLPNRYRDRAKERREGKLTTGADENTAAVGLGVQDFFLLVPHNIRGLDLSLVKKEQLKLKLEATSDGGNGKSATTTKTIITGKNNNVVERKSKCALESRDEMPTSDQAHQILQAFLTCGNGKYENNDYDDVSPPMILSNGLVNYLSEILTWKTLDISTWEGKPSIGATTLYSLQHTKFSLAIDGNPSDPFRAWEIPRQYTLSQGGGSGSVVSSSALLPTDVIIQINAIFRNQNDIREEMMKRQNSNAGDHRSSMNFKREKPMTDNNNEFNNGTDEDECDDDMFGGLDEHQISH